MDVDCYLSGDGRGDGMAPILLFPDGCCYDRCPITSTLRGYKRFRLNPEADHLLAPDCTDIKYSHDRWVAILPITPGELQQCVTISEQQDYQVWDGSNATTYSHNSMQYSNDIEMWSMEGDNSPLATLTADFAEFKRKFRGLLSSGLQSDTMDSPPVEVLSHSPRYKAPNRPDVTKPHLAGAGSNGGSTYKTAAAGVSHPFPLRQDVIRPELSDNKPTATHNQSHSKPADKPRHHVSTKSTAKRPNVLPVKPIIDTRLDYREPRSQRAMRQHASQGGSTKYVSSHQQPMRAQPQRPRRKCDRPSLSSTNTVTAASTPYYPSHQADLPGRGNHLTGQCEKDSEGTEAEQEKPTSILNDISIGATHRGTHRFMPRHDDELAIEIGDSIHVLEEDEDGWCLGININTGKQGIFPSVYATDLSFYETDMSDVGKHASVTQHIFRLHYLGSVEVCHYKGTDVLIDAIEKIVVSRQQGKDNPPPPLCHLEVNTAGIKMIDVTHRKRSKKYSAEISDDRPCDRLRKLIAFSKETRAVSNHFFSLKNISFCGYHPEHPRYFAFITKHPTQSRYACHCYTSLDKSSQALVDCVGEAFQNFYHNKDDEHEAYKFTIPEDIYLE